MGLGNLLLALIVSCSLAVIIFNVVILSANTALKLDSTGPSLNPVVKMPVHKSSQEGRGSDKGRRLFHTAVASWDSVYNTWQCRIMYYWFKKARNGPGSDMGGFTRILHNGKPDDFMDEIPTFVAQPLPKGMDKGYLVLHRPWALVQWLQQADIKEDYILMADPDHIIVKPIPNLSRDGLPAAYPFFYIEPEEYEHILRKFFPKEKGPITSIDPIGGTPLIIGKESLKKIAPTWMNISLAMKNDAEADREFNWVLDMYAYGISSALHGVANILYEDFMIQPPGDTTSDNAFIIHYTYTCNYDSKGKWTHEKIGEWSFDKRKYWTRWLPRNFSMPPPGTPESVVTLGYIVLNRPWAFVQWLQQADIKEDYILMTEPDHIIVKPIPNLSWDGLGAAFHFDYIKPKKNEHILRKFFPKEKGPITSIDPIGSSPVIIGKESLKKIAPTWMNISLAMKNDPEADREFEWVLEMYAYAVSSALHGVANILYKDFMIQPPGDTKIGNAFIIHYTYTCNYDSKGEWTEEIGEWSFDKRNYLTDWLPRNLSMPPPEAAESVVTLMRMLNEASANLPNWGS